MANTINNKFDRIIDLLTKISKSLPIEQKKTPELKSGESKDIDKKKDSDQPREVIKSDVGVRVDEYGDGAKAFWKDLYDKHFGMTEKKDEKKQENGKSWLSKLLGPGTLMVLGALGGFIAALLSGGFGDIIKDFKEGKITDGLKKIGEKIYQVFKPILHSLPIIGPMLSFWDAFTAFQEGDWIRGLNNLGQGIVGLLPLPRAWKAAIFGGMDVLTELAEKKFGAFTIEKGRGREIMAIAMKAIGSVLKFGMLKRLPIIGSMFNFYDGYLSFQAGGSAGIIDGLLAVAAGIANLVPGAGTPLSIGIDVLRMFMFTKTEDKEGNTVISAKGSAANMASMAAKAIGILFKGPLLKRIPIIGSFVNFYDAYQSFRAGGAAGILDGTASLLAGLANFVPGLGTPVSLGIDVLRMLMFEKTVDAKGNEKVNARGWTAKIGDFIMGYQPFKMLKHLSQAIGFFSTGDWKSGFTSIGKAIPVFGVLAEILGGTAGVLAGGGSLGDKMKGIGEVIQKAAITFVLRMLPDWIASKAAKFFGIEWNTETQEIETTQADKAATAGKADTKKDDEAYKKSIGWKSKQTRANEAKQLSNASDIKSITDQAQNPLIDPDTDQAQNPLIDPDTGEDLSSPEVQEYNKLPLGKGFQTPEGAHVDIKESLNVQKKSLMHNADTAESIKKSNTLLEQIVSALTKSPLQGNTTVVNAPATTQLTFGQPTPTTAFRQQLSY